MCSWLPLLQVALLLFVSNIAPTYGATGAGRSKRFLIFPRQAPTRYQFIGGIGIPADLSYESLTIGHVLKAEYWLPFNETVFRENPFWPEYQNNVSYVNWVQTQRSNLRWDLYEYIAKRLDSYGYNGQECMLKAICESSSLRFMHHYSVFAELLHIFFSPSTSADKNNEQSTHFKEAERLGRQKRPMCGIYGCSLSLLDWVSRVVSVTLPTD